MKRLLILTMIGVAATQVVAVTKFKDMPANYWAAPAVYDLVRMGVTNGYPDGTFRGNKPITRYETAIFLSKLSQALNTNNQDLQTEVKSLRDQVVALQNTPKTDLVVQGNYQGNWLFGNVLSAQPSTNKGGVGNYRLMLEANKIFDNKASLRIGLDTMDYGYFNDGTSATRGLLATDLLDIESKINLDMSGWNLKEPVELKLTYGPGPKQHLADPTNVLPSEIGVTYWRPNTGVLASTRLLGLDVSGGYYSVQGTTQDVTGKINTSWITGNVGMNLYRDIRLGLTGDYISRGLFSNTDRNIKAKVNLVLPLGNKAQAETIVGLGRSSSTMMVAGTLALNDPWETGTVVTVKAAKIGAQYINTDFAGEQFYLAGLDYFSRPLESGTVNFGGELVQAVSDRAKLIGKGDLRLSSDYKYSGPKARVTAQGGISYNVAPDVNLDAAYRVYQDKGLNDTSDLAQVGLIYRF